jgi:mRNA interferase RelE/StbE
MAATGGRHEVVIHPKAERDLRAFSPDLARRILAAAIQLGDDPRPRGKRTRRLVRLTPPAFRLRVGDYRVLYRVAEDSLTVFIPRVIHRSDLARGIAGMPRV